VVLRPREKLSPAQAEHLPLFGRDPLNDADVAMMVRPDFHDDPKLCNLEIRRRRARRRGALVGMYGLAGLAAAALAKMRVDDYDAVGGFIHIKIQTRQLILPITPALKFVLDDWKRHRPTDKGDAMFPSERGEPDALSIDQFLRQLGWRLGTQRQLGTLLLEYHRANIATGGHGAYKAYWGIRRSSKRAAVPTGEFLRPLVVETDPFRNKTHFWTRPQAYFARADTGLTPSVHLVSDSTVGKRLEPDHPLAIALTATLVKGRQARINKVDEFFNNFTPEIDRVVACGEACLTSLSAMCRMKHQRFVDRMQQARLGPIVRKARPVEPPIHSPRGKLTVDEARRVDAIAAKPWPRTLKGDFRRDLLKQHFPFVRGLLGKHKITYKAAKKLFRLTTKGLTLRVFDFDNGLLDLATGPRPGPKERQIHQALAIREYAAEPGRGLTALWKRLRVQYRYPLDYPAFAAIIRNFMQGRYQGRLSARSKSELPKPPPRRQAARITGSCLTP
jgi:hypothetical protein